jgi:hypothetical protein
MGGFGRLFSTVLGVSVVLGCGIRRESDTLTGPITPSATTIEHLGDLPAGASFTMEIMRVNGEVAFNFLVDSTLVDHLIPAQFRVFRLRDLTASSTHTARYLTAHPERAGWVLTTLAFASYDSLAISGRAFTQTPVNHAFWWAHGPPASDIDARALGAPWHVEFAAWADDDLRQQLERAGSPLQEARLRVERDKAGVWHVALSAADLILRATCRPVGEHSRMESSLPAYGTVWDGGAQLDRFTVFTFAGHYEQSCAADWLVEGSSLLARAMQTASARDMAELAEPPTVLDGWTARAGYYRRQ